MAVVLANAHLTLRRKEHPYERDAHGTPVAREAFGAPVGPFPGAVVEPPDGPESRQQYRLRLDPGQWPVRRDDMVETDDGRAFIVRTARMCSVPGYDYVDHVQVTADLTPPLMP